MKVTTIAVLMSCLIVTGVYAQDVISEPATEAAMEVSPGGEQPPAASKVAAPWYGEALADGLHLLLGMLWKLTFVLVGGYIASKIRNADARAQAMDALRAGVEASWQKIGKEFKRINAENDKLKFTSDQREKLRKLATTEATAIAKGSARKLLETAGKDILASWIAAIVKKRKNNA